ncbi:MAG: MarR family transcriptional regulator [Dehalococcoidales bacterium]|jgi:DNA-binding MarR family transcriptional regulator|nr:MarR family transcriptional regulator [Dehalococcoidales bacterium]
MRRDLVNRTADDLLSVPPLIFRGVRRKLLKTALDSINVEVSPLHFEIMRLLKEHGTLRITEIGERLQLARAQMTHLIDKLVELEIVERQADSADRRVTNIVLADKGRAFLEEHGGNIWKATKEFVSGLTDEELADLSASLERLRDILSRLQ